MFGLRLRLMSALDYVMHRRARDHQAAMVAADDIARARRIGPQGEAIKNLASTIQKG